MQISNHRLDDPSVTWTESPNHGGKMAAGFPDTIVIHYTAGRTAQSSVGTLCQPGGHASAHLVVGRKGELFQLVPFDTVAWHAGRSSYRGRSSFNQFSVGIEIDNAGPLTRTGEGKFVSWFGGIYPASDSVEGIHRNETTPRFWLQYTEVQLALVEQICALLIATYPIKLIVGHEEIAPGRKTDPGPAFPLDRLRGRLLTDLRSDDGEAENVPVKTVDVARVIAGRLNVRNDARVQAPLAGEPLIRGQMVQVVKESSGWTLISRPLSGWVKSEYVQRV